MSRLALLAAILAGGVTAATAASAAGTSLGPAGRTGYVQLNPQPLPPDPPPGQVLLNRGSLNPGTLGGINPQPLPPGGMQTQILRR